MIHRLVNLKCIRFFAVDVGDVINKSDSYLVFSGVSLGSDIRLSKIECLADLFLAVTARTLHPCERESSDREN